MNYVVVFVRRMGHVLLIRKSRPLWQAGKLNLPGGKIEEGETPMDAARRELKEETGLAGVNFRDTGFIKFSGEDHSGLVHIFTCDNYELDKEVQNSDPTEPVLWFEMRGILNRTDLIPNLRVLIPLLYVGCTGIELEACAEPPDGRYFIRIRDLEPNEIVV